LSNRDPDFILFILLIPDDIKMGNISFPAKNNRMTGDPALAAQAVKLGCETSGKTGVFVVMWDLCRWGDPKKPQGIFRVGK